MLLDEFIAFKIGILRVNFSRLYKRCVKITLGFIEAYNRNV